MRPLRVGRSLFTRRRLIAAWCGWFLTALMLPPIRKTPTIFALRSKSAAAAIASA